MAKYFLPDHVRLCRTHADTVGLDLERNRYFCLGERETRALVMLGVAPAYWTDDLAHEHESISTTDAQQMAAALVGLQLLANGSGPRMQAATLHFDAAANLASAGYEHNECTAIRPHHAANLVRAWIWASYALKAHSMYRVSRQVRLARLHARRAGGAFDASRATALVGTFRTLRPFLYSARERCLLHALTLVRFLGFYGEHPFWVIGVHTRPWAAHSWVQCGALILDARPDDVCEYTPILVA